MNESTAEKKVTGKKIALAALLALIVGGGLTMGGLAVSASPKASETRPYSVQVASFKTVEEAKQTVRRLSAQGIKAYVVKRADEDGAISIDVHSGAFADEAGALALRDELAASGLVGSSVSNYADLKEEVGAFTRLKVEDKKEFSLKNAEKPALSESVNENIAFFPVDSDFRIERLAILDCANTLRGTDADGYFEIMFEALPRNFDMGPLADSMKVVSQAVYADKLYGHKVAVSIVSTDNAREDYASVIALNEGSWGAKIEDGLKYKTAKGVLTGGLYETTGESGKSSFVYAASIPESGHVLLMKSDDCPSVSFKELIAKGGNDLGLLNFPEIRKNLFVLPKFTDKDKLAFSCFSFDLVPAEYEKQRNYASWAHQIVGSYRSSGYYTDENRKVVSVSFFNLNYTKAAETVHDAFMSYREGASGYKTDVRSNPGYYAISPYTGDELSFSNGSYIIAINLFDDMGLNEEDRLAYVKTCADSLQIW